MTKRGRKLSLRHEHGPILIDDDDDDNDSVTGLNQSRQEAANTDPPEIIDLDELIKQEALEKELFGDIAKVIDLTDDLIIEAERQVQRSPTPQTLSSYDIGGGFLVTPGSVLQIKKERWQTQPEHDILAMLFTDFFGAEFLQVESIIAPHFGSGGKPVFRGRVYARAKHVERKFPKKINEVVLIANVDLTDPRPWQEQCLVDIPPQMLGSFRELRVTNAGYPAFKYDTEELRRKNLNRQGYVQDCGPLVCRHRYIRYFNGPEKMQQLRPHEWAIERVREDEAVNERYRVASDDLRKAWRGGRRRGGAHVPDPDSDRSETTNLYPGQMYTAGDTFAGGGGASRGMTMAGAFVKFAVDNWDRAVQSLKANFAPATKVCHSDVSDLITKGKVDSVDILHLSPPCQVWSPAHTVPGKNDAMNEAVLFSCGPLLNALKPRMFTLEQTFGILHARFDPQFSRLICDFVELGYSIRFQVVNLATFGLPQPRKRLIVLGAGPGETLPEFPKPTHCLDRRGHHGLKPFVSARRAIAHLDNLDWDHGSDHQYILLKTQKEPWDPKKLMNTITTGGGHNNHHWDGEREFTIMEFAALQGFPIEHKFEGTKTDKKKQIGNAFPPKVVKVFYEHLIACLDKIDGIPYRPKGYAPPGVPVYELDPIDVDEYIPQRRRRGHIKRSESASNFSGSGTSVEDPMEID